MGESTIKASDYGASADHALVPMRYFTWLLDPENLPSISQSALLQGVPYRDTTLANPEQLIEWRFLCRICENLHSMMSDEELLRLARTSLKRPQNRLLKIVSRTLLNVREAYHWGYRARDGLVVRTYPSLTSSVTDLPDGRVQIDISPRPGARLPRSMQILMQGQIGEIPEVFDLPCAAVEMKALPGGVRYVIDHHENNRLLSRMRVGIKRVFSRRTTATELNATLQAELGKLHDTMHALVQSESRYQLLANNIRDIIWTTDMRGCVTYISPSISRYTNHDAQSFIGERGLELLGSMDNQRRMRRIVMRELARARRGEEEATRSRTVELTITAPDGDNVVFEVLVSTARDEAGTPTGILCVGRDISERQRLTEQVAQKRNLESLGLLAGGVAHDFNNLMTAVLGHTELIGARLAQNDPLQQDLQRIAHSAESAAGLCRQMLAFSGKATLVERELDMSARTRLVLDLIRRSLPHQPRLHLDLAPELPTILADSGQLDQIIMNLVLNAAEAMPQGGDITLRTCTRLLEDNDPAFAQWPGALAPGEYVCLEVTDTGVGIDQQIIDRIFEPFYSTKANGRGMGLAAVAGVARTYGGALLAQSPPPDRSNGARFTVALPVSHEAVARAAAHAEVPGTIRQGQAPDKAPRRVLIIDDEPGIREVAGKLMRSLGYEVDSAASGEEGVEKFSAAPEQPAVDLVILDLTMPGMDGHETYQHLRQHHTTVPILFMSGYHHQGLSFAESFDPNAAFIPKPFHLKDLRDAIRGMQDSAAQTRH